MKMTPGEIIALGSLLVLFVFNLVSQWRISGTKESEEAEQITKISMQISAVLQGVDEIKAEIKDMKKDIKEDHDRVIVLDQEVNILREKIDKLGAHKVDDAT